MGNGFARSGCASNCRVYHFFSPVQQGKTFYMRRFPGASPQKGVADALSSSAIPRRAPREAASPLRRSWANCTNTRSALYKLRRVSDSTSEYCRQREDHQHVLLHCAEYKEERKRLFRCCALIDVPYSSTQGLLLPDAPPRLAQKGFQPLLEFLRETGLGDRF